jgi:hypothetical protein
MCVREVPKQVGQNCHTHDWEVWLRGVSDKNGKRDKIEHYIDKVGRPRIFSA